MISAIMVECTYAFGDFTFSDSKGLRRRGVAIHLPRRRRMLLSLLLEAGGNTVDHHTMDRGHSAKPRPERAAIISLAQNVFWLRRQLGDEKGTIIQTVLKSGYRIGTAVNRIDATAGASAQARAQESAPSGGGDMAPPPAIPDVVERTIVPPPANENASVQPDCSLTPEIVSAMSVSGSIRPADHARRSISGLSVAIKQPAAMPENLATLGWLTGAFLGDIEEGLSQVDKALEHVPQLSVARFYKAWLLLGAKQLDTAMAVLDEGLASDGRNANLLFLKGWVLCAQARLEELNGFLTRALVLHPNHLLLRALRSINLALQGEFRKAHGLLSQTALLFPHSTMIIALMAWIDSARGERSEALKFLTMRQKTAGGYMSPLSIAAVYNVLGHETETSAYLGFARVDQDPWRHLVWCDPRFRSLSQGQHVLPVNRRPATWDAVMNPQTALI